MQQPPIEWLESVVRLAEQAGKKVLQIYQQDNEVLLKIKSDGSPLTEADRIAHEFITAGLSALTPDIPILSEESTDIPFSERAEWERYWLIDPLDGTKEFIHRTGDFTINIALIDHHHPIMGVVYAPVLDACYFACQHHGAFRRLKGQTQEPIRTRPWQGGRAHIVTSRRHGTEELKSFLEQLSDYEVVPMGSSLKFCLVAEGNADIYPRLGLTSEWDTAAAQCIVEQAGGAVVDMHGVPLQYNTRDSVINPHFLVIGNNSKLWLECLKLQTSS